MQIRYYTRKINLESDIIKIWDDFLIKAIPINKMKRAMIYLKNNKHLFPKSVTNINTDVYKYYSNTKNHYDEIISDLERLYEIDLTGEYLGEVKDYHGIDYNELLLRLIEVMYNWDTYLSLDIDGRVFSNFRGFGHWNSQKDYDYLKYYYDMVYNTPSGKAYIEGEKIAKAPLPTYSEEQSDIFSSESTRNIFPELTAAIQYMYLNPSRFAYNYLKNTLDQIFDLAVEYYNISPIPNKTDVIENMINIYCGNPLNKDYIGTIYGRTDITIEFHNHLGTLLSILINAVKQDNYGRAYIKRYLEDYNKNKTLGLSYISLSGNPNIDLKDLLNQVYSSEQKYSSISKNSNIPLYLLIGGIVLYLVYKG